MAVLRFTVPTPDPLDSRALRVELRAAPALAGVAVNLISVAGGQVNVEAYHDPATADPAAVQGAVEAVFAGHAAGQVEAAADRTAFRVTAQQAARAREVWNGEAVFTDSQMQKIAAGVVLDWWRRQQGGGG